MPPVRAFQAVKCVTCGTPDNVFCGGCFGTPGAGGGYMHITWICSTKCAVPDELVHEPACPNVQAQEMLYRAGGLLQKLFYTYREVGYRRKIVDIKERDGKIYFHENYNVKNRATLFNTGLLAKTNVMKLKDKEAILSYDASGTAAACMHEVVKYVLSFLTTNITEVCVKPSNFKRTAVVVDSDGNELPRIEEHEVLRVVMRCGATHALDLTGAQYGYHDQPLTPYLTYTENRTDGYVVRGGFAYFGGLRDKHTLLVQTEVFEGRELDRARVDKALGELVLQGITDWEEKSGITVHQLLTVLHDEIFEGGEEELVKTVQEVLVKRLTFAMVEAAVHREVGFERYL